MLIGVRAEQFDDVAFAQTFVLQPLIFLGGVFYSAALLPQPFETLTRFNPIFYMINLVRYGFVGYSEVSIPLSLLALTGATAAIFFVNLRLFTHRVPSTGVMPGEGNIESRDRRDSGRRPSCRCWPCVAFGAAKADAYVYWGDFQNGRIGRAANDGTEVDDSFVAEAGTGPDAVAVDAGHVYWADQTGESIGRANIDGSGVEEQLHHRRRQSNRPGGDRVLDLLVDADGGTVGRAAINGTGKNVNFISGPPGPLPCGVAVDSGHVYWADIDNSGAPAYIGRAGLDGNNVEAHFVTIPGTSFPCGVAVNAANIYWTEPGLFGGGTRIGRANINGGGTADPSFIGEGSEPCGIAVFGLQLFWANCGKQRDRQGEHRCDRAQSILHPNRGQSDLRGRRRCPAAAAAAQTAGRLSEPGRRRAPARTSRRPRRGSRPAPARSSPRAGRGSPSGRTRTARPSPASSTARSRWVAHRRSAIRA